MKIVFAVFVGWTMLLMGLHFSLFILFMHLIKKNSIKKNREKRRLQEKIQIVF